jgi:integrase
VSATVSDVARTRVGRDDRGRVCVFGSARTPDGQRLRKRLIVPDDDEALAAETARELNRRFALGDLSWFQEESHRVASKPAARAPTVSDWCDRWLEHARGEIGDRTWRNYRSDANDLAERFADRRMDQLSVSDLITLRRDLKLANRSERTARNRLAFLRLLFRDARLAGIVQASPFDVPLPRRRTKHDRLQRQTKRVTFRPLLAAEIEHVLATLRSPRDDMERMWFPLTELLLLTGLRWGEGAALMWPDVSERGGLVHVQRTVALRGRIEPTKTGASWTIPLRAPLAALLRQQRKYSYVGRTQGWIFPNRVGGPLDYNNWRHRGWERVLERSKVSPREGDAQKALRRSYITSALVCGRNPKLVAAELGHATSHMVVSNYDSFLDPRSWPDANEIGKLRATYGWEVREAPEWAPRGHPLGVTPRAPKRARAQVRRNKKRSGAPGGIRTPDPQVRSLMLYPAELPARVERRYRSATRSAPRAPAGAARGARCAAPGSSRVAFPRGRRVR